MWKPAKNFVQSDEGFRRMEICELLGISPRELGEMSRFDILTWSQYIDEKYRRWNKRFGGST